MFNFEQAIANAKKDLEANHVAAIVLAPQGGGKSSLLGTFGCKTLYLYGSAEDHGPKAAKVYGGDNIEPLCFDPKVDESGKTLTPDEQYNRVLSILTSAEKIKKMGVGAIGMDSATELENLVRSTTKWSTMCLTDKGKHNGFAEPAATLAMLRPIVTALKALQRELGIHFAMTCILDVKSVGDTGEILESAPRLTGYSVAEGLIQQFPDVIAIGRMVKGDKVRHRIQFLAGMSKDSKDAVGRVKKTINFTPRLTGVTNLPETMDADLSKVAELKANGGK